MTIDEYQNISYIADMHTHTCASTHAFSTIRENAEIAKERGIKFLAMTDHGIDMPDAPHLWCFFAMAKNIPPQIFGVNIIRGMESNIIDYSGNIDIYDKYIYRDLKWLIASFHSPCCPPGTEEQNTSAYIGALDNPHVNCLGHIDNTDYIFDIDRVVKHCGKLGKAIEVNCARLAYGEVRLERYRKILTACMKYKTGVVVDSDAHYCEKVGDFDLATKLFKEMNFPMELVYNADEKRFVNFLKNVRGLEF